MNLWKDVLMNLKEDGVSAKEAIDVKKKKKPMACCSRIWRLRMNSVENGG